MSVNTLVIDAPPDAVYAVLADPMRYADWVVGAKRIRGADDEWPKAGARFEHTVGVGPAKTDDETSVVANEPNRRVVLHAKVRPVGTARVALHLEPVDGGRTKVRMEESIVSGPFTSIGPFVDPLIWLRNAESLRRLARIVTQPTPASGAAGS